MLIPSGVPRAAMPRSTRVERGKVWAALDCEAA